VLTAGSGGRLHARRLTAGASRITMQRIIETTPPFVDATPIGAMDAIDAIEVVPPIDLDDRRGPGRGPGGASGSRASAAVASPDRPVREIPRTERWADGPGGDDRYPPWVCAILLVAYCAVFWAGVLAVGQWVVNGLSAIFG